MNYYRPYFRKTIRNRPISGPCPSSIEFDEEECPYCGKCFVIEKNKNDNGRRTCHHCGTGLCSKCAEYGDGGDLCKECCREYEAQEFEKELRRRYGIGGD